MQPLVHGVDLSSEPGLGAPATPEPQPLLTGWQRFQRRQCLAAGVKLSKDGRSVFTYNPATLTTGLNFIRLFLVAPNFIGRAFWVQLVCVYVWIVIYALGISDSAAGAMWSSPVPANGMLDVMLETYWNDYSTLTRFVLGLYVSLSLAQTYYANRTVFGTTFGSSLGATQMIAAWIKAPDDTHEQRTSASSSARSAAPCPMAQCCFQIAGA